MKITYLSHASFLITTQAGTRIVTDPIDPAGYPDKLSYRAFDEEADIVTMSHEHADHTGLSVVKGNPVVIRGAGEFAACEVRFLGVATYHDEEKGEKRGRNVVYIISVDGLRIAHMGDLGHVLTADQAAEMGNVDIVLIPVGGFYTIDAAQAQVVADQLDANIVIPMHYKTDKCEFPIAGVREFIEGKPNVVRVAGSTLEITKESIPSKHEIVVLEHAL